MKIAIIGSGISGLTSAYFLSKNHEVWLFEKNDYLGGHSHTVQVEESDRVHNIDTGFIVCNKKTYPNFMHLLKELSVDLQESSMGFSVKDDATGLEFSGSSLNTIFAQRKNIFNYNYIKMLHDIYKFNNKAKEHLNLEDNMKLQDFLDKHKIGESAKKYYILPIISAIWSANLTQALEFPVSFLFSFLNNHGLLDFNSAPQWYTIKGGSISYVNKIHDMLGKNVFLNEKVDKITPIGDKFKVKTKNIEIIFDKVVVAIHSDQVLDILDYHSPVMSQVFNNIKYQRSAVTLHTDTRILPKKRAAWASWNYFLNDSDKANLTYNMNILQGLKSNSTYCISLNLDDDINEDCKIAHYEYEHPIFNEQSVKAAKMWDEVSLQNIHFCGAYWGYGFHEDGVNSALREINKIDKDVLCRTPYTQAL